MNEKQPPKPMPGTVADKIRKARESQYPRLTHQSLGRMIDKARATVTAYETGRRDVPRDVVQDISKALNIPVSWFFDAQDSPVPELHGRGRNVERAPMGRSPQITLVPYWGTVPCGEWERPANDDWELIQVSERYEEVRDIIAVRVSGRSMEPRFRHGQLVVIKLGTERKDGVIVLAENGNRELTLKVLAYTPTGWQLQSINPEYGNANADEWKLVGYAIGFEEFDPQGIRP